MKKSMEKYLNQGLFTDISFELDDGYVKAHRAILIARCDVMRAMLNGDFREAHANVVCLNDINIHWLVIHVFSLSHSISVTFQIIFPGVTEYSFHKLLYYLYTDEIPAISAEKCLNLLELANRLCLPRLLNLVERRVVEDLTKISQNESALTIEHCLKLLESVKVRSKPEEIYHFD